MTQSLIPQPLSEADRAALERILSAHPDVFIRQPELLEGLELRHGPTGGAISLIERQTLALRGRIQTLEAKMADMLRFAEENEAISSRLLGWVRGLLLCPTPADRIDLLPASIAEIFQVPSVGLGLWQGALAEQAAALPPSEARPAWWLSPGDAVAEQFGELRAPLCLSGPSRQAHTAYRLLPPEAMPERGSMALLPLRQGLAPTASGLLVLASGDPGRFAPNHGTEFLERIAELASAALLACPRPPRSAATASQPF